MGRVFAELHRDIGEIPTTAGGLVRSLKRGAFGLVAAVLVFALPSTATAWAIGTAPQSQLTITNIINSGTAGTPITLSTGGGSGNGAVTFAVSGVGCTVNGTALNAAQPGTCTVWAINAGDSVYARATSPTVQFTFVGVAQSTLTITNSSTVGYVGTPITVTATGGSGTGGLSYAVTGMGCAISGNQLSVFQPATCRVIASRAGSGPYTKVSSTTVVFTFAAAAPTDLVLSYTASSGVPGTPITLSSSGGSGNGPVTFSTSGVGCSIVGSDLTASQPTKCAAWATKAAQGQFPRVTSLSTSFTFTADTQTALSISNLTTTGTAGTPITVTTTGGSGSGVRSLSVVGAGCSVNGMTVSATISPTCIVKATKAASGIYALTTSAPVTFTFTGVAQSTFYISNSVRTAFAGSNVTVTSLGGSGSGAVTYSATGAGCSVTGAVLTATQPTTCTVIGTKAASGSYGPAFTAPADFIFAGVPQSALSITNDVLSGDAGTPITVTTAGGSGTGVITFVVVGAACRLTGSDLVATETTTCTVTASKAPSGVYARATSAPVTFTFTATAQDTLVISNTTRTNTADTAVTLTTTGGSGSGAVSYSATGPGCVVVGAVLTVTQPTTCSVVATKAPSGIYGSATSARVSFTFTAAAQSTLSISNASTSAVAGTAITLTTSGGSGQGAVTYSVTGTGCTVTGASLTVTQPTSCTVTAYKAASGIYASTASAPVMFTFTAVGDEIPVQLGGGIRDLEYHDNRSRGHADSGDRLRWIGIGCRLLRGHGYRLLNDGIGPQCHRDHHVSCHRDQGGVGHLRRRHECPGRLHLLRCDAGGTADHQSVQEWHGGHTPHRDRCGRFWQRRGVDCGDRYRLQCHGNGSQHHGTHHLHGHRDKSGGWHLCGQVE